MRLIRAAARIAVLSQIEAMDGRRGRPGAAGAILKLKGIFDFLAEVGADGIRHHIAAFLKE